METQVSRITIRVYGILTDPERGLLVSDELDFGCRFTKFPGGGLEPGEGLRDCLIREWFEETSQALQEIRHFYTTDFFQRSAFHKDVQVISIYYRVTTNDVASLRVSAKPFDFPDDVVPAQSLRWIGKNEFSPEHLTFPIDRFAARMMLDAEWYG